MAVVESLSADVGTYVSKPLTVDPSSPGYPYAPGYTPSAVPLSINQLHARVSTVLKGSLEAGQEITVRYLPAHDAGEETPEALTPTGVRYLVYLVPEAGTSYFPVNGPYAVLRGPAAGAVPDEQRDVYVPISRMSGGVPGVTIRQVRADLAGPSG